MSRKKSENSENKSHMREKLTLFIKVANLEKSKGWFGDQIGATGQNVNDWLKSGSLPGWALIKIVTVFPEAQRIFGVQPTIESTGESVAREMAAPWYTHPKRRQLMEKAKRLVETGDDKAINALLENVVQFQEKSDLLRENEKLRGGNIENAVGGKDPLKTISDDPTELERLDRYELKHRPEG